MARVELKGVSKVYPGQARPAVADCTLEAQDKELVVLVGPSGCGKTTLLRMVAGLEEVTRGEIWIGERMVNHLPPKDRDIAMVFQNYALYPHMTVYKNLAFGLLLRKAPQTEIDRRVRQAAEILGLGAYLDRKPKALSGGERQRVALGRAIVRQPQVFLLDEPLSNLDAAMRVAMRAEIVRLHDRLATTMLYVTHDQVEAMTMGDRIVVMNEGAVQQIDTPMGLYERPANRFVAGFIGSPAMNFLEGRLIEEGGALAFDAGETLRLAVASVHCDALRRAARAGTGEVTLGLRPEHFVHAARGERAGGAWQPLRARVEVAEPTGAETYVTLAAGPHRLVARLEGHARLERDGEMELLADMSRAHWFDKRTGKAIL